MRWTRACEEGCAGQDMRLDARGSYLGLCADGAGGLIFFREREEACRSTEAAARGPSHQAYGTLLQDL